MISTALLIGGITFLVAFVALFVLDWLDDKRRSEAKYERHSSLLKPLDERRKELNRMARELNRDFELAHIEIEFRELQATKPTTN